MGKKQHSQDRMYITATEWKRDFGGHKGSAASSSAFARLPLECCAISFLPFTHPVCDPSGHIFDLENIVPYVQKHHLNPVTNEPLELNQLTKLKFSRSAEGVLQCAVKFEPFGDSSHVVALRTTGNVYSYDAIDTLCFKAKSLRDLLDDTPFTREDIITLQDPKNFSSTKNMHAFAHVKDDKVAKQVEALKGKKGDEAAAASTAASSTSSSSGSAASSQPASTTPAPSGGGGRFRPSLAISLAQKPTGAAAALASLTGTTAAAASASSGPARGLYSSGAVSGSFTSTSMSVATKNERSVLTPEQILAQHYAHLKQKKAKGYVRLSTTLGNINLELHVDLVPRTCHNFLELCERGYYKDTIFHRVIPGFMVQGGDPEGTGRGGEGAFERKFQDEFHPSLVHDSRGILAMANSGPNTNGSQFYILFDAANHLNNKHTVFGRAVGGGEVLDAIEKVDTIQGKNESKPKDAPVKDITITAVQIFDNPFKAEFVPVDQLTQKKENEQAKDAMEDESEKEQGKWFSAPTAASSGLAANTDPSAPFKYLSLPQPINASTTTSSSASSSQPRTASKRKESPTASDPATSAVSSLPPSLRTPTSGTPMDTSRTPQTQKQTTTSSYGNFNDW